MVCLLLVIGVIIGSSSSSSSKKEVHNQNKLGYSFINPLLECADIESVTDKNILKTKTDVLNIIKNRIDNGDTSYVSVYFRDLNNGPWFGINEKEEFYPASMLKLPLMLSVLRMAEKNEALLDKKIKFGGSDITTDQYYPPQKPIEPEKVYSIADLIEKTIKYSDNDAAGLLMEAIPPKEVSESYTDLGLKSPEDDIKNDYKINVKTYASFFRILFNSSYLSKNYSEAALLLLSQTDFDEGLRADIPAKIAIAHKFGERISPNGERQLHDCGIIYLPDTPYLLCVMSRGKNMDKLSSVIKEISNKIFADTTKGSLK